jgi:hypothetical protein
MLRMVIMQNADEMWVARIFRISLDPTHPGELVWNGVFMTKEAAEERATDEWVSLRREVA